MTVRTLLLIAAMLVALWAAAAQEPVSSLGRGEPLPPIAMSGQDRLDVHCTVGCKGPELFNEIVAVVEHNTFDPHGILFFELRLKGESVTVSADADTALAKALRTLAGTKARIWISPASVEEITR